MIMNKILISGIEFSDEELEGLRNELSNENVEIETIKGLDLIGNNGLVSIICTFISGLGTNAVYDMLKQYLGPVFKRVLDSRKTGTTFEITCNGQTDSVYLGFELSDEQKDKIVDAVVERLTTGNKHG